MIKKNLFHFLRSFFSMKKFLKEVGLSEYFGVRIWKGINYVGAGIFPIVSFSFLQIQLVRKKELDKEFAIYYKNFKIESLEIGKGIFMLSVYQNGIYIGDLSFFLFFIIVLGAEEFFALHDSNVASIARTKDNIFYGYSHRAIYGFKVGDKIEYKDDLLILTPGVLEDSPEYERELKRIEEIKKLFKDGVLEIKDNAMAYSLAKRFAESVA